LRSLTPSQPTNPENPTKENFPTLTLEMIQFEYHRLVSKRKWVGWTLGHFLAAARLPFKENELSGTIEGVSLVSRRGCLVNYES
jgi:hypothetical protein